MYTVQWNTQEWQERSCSFGTLPLALEKAKSLPSIGAHQISVADKSGNVVYWGDEAEGSREDYSQAG